jgi:ABC transporter with metal-binding/Fe-S-binding domain ATP-binding protein
MKLAALFSGGKDSTYSIYAAQKVHDHTVDCLITISPTSADSHLLHHPNINITKLQATRMNIPHIYENSSSDDTETELSLLHDMLYRAKRDYDIKGLVHGGILSTFQKNKFDKVCKTLGLTLVSPLWNRSQQYQYMLQLLDSNFRFIITSVSSDGLDDSWLGTEITHDNLDVLKDLAEKFRFNINFEGGEAETLVIDCPLFEHHLNIRKSKKHWDGYRGRFEIEDIS